MTDDVVSGATETTLEREPSSDDTQTEGEQPQEQEQAAPKEPVNWRQRQKEDAELNAHVQKEIARARTRWQRQQLRNSARAVAEANDPEAALGLAQHFANQEDDDDDEDGTPGEYTNDPRKIALIEQAQPHIERLLRLENGRATNPYYIALYQRVGGAEMDRRYAANPVEFANWVDDEIMDMRVSERVNKVGPSLAAAKATDDAHQRLRGMQTPLGGGTTGGTVLTLEAYDRMTPAERRELGRKNPRAIDEMIARASR